MPHPNKIKRFGSINSKPVFASWLDFSKLRFDESYEDLLLSLVRFILFIQCDNHRTRTSNSRNMIFVHDAFSGLFMTTLVLRGKKTISQHNWSDTIGKQPHQMETKLNTHTFKKGNTHRTTNDSTFNVHEKGNHTVKLSRKPDKGWSITCIHAIYRPKNNEEKKCREKYK